MHKKAPKGSSFSAILLSILILAVLDGCSTIPKSVLQSDPAERLEKTPEVYVRLSNAALEDIAANLDDDEIASLVNSLGGKSQTNDDGYTVDHKSLQDLVGRTKVLGLGLSGINTKSPQAEAVLIGNFPVFSMKLALSSKGKWNKTSSGYQAKEAQLYLRPLQQGLLHAASFPPSDEIASGKAKPAGAVPERFKNMTSDFAVVVNAPEILLNFRALPESSAIPISEIVVQGTRSRNPEGQDKAAYYLLDAFIVMKDADAAKVFKPVVKLLWAFSSERIFGSGISAADSPLVLDGDMYKAEGIRASSEALVTMLDQFMAGP
ncbi:MAG: hypothetical protein LLF89_04050 [Spirochaetaceae bacterium]|nr:hypothetical protein [Spirochaetaceae bacterium]